jgi:NADPH-ferrihemoprotein reductase
MGVLSYACLAFVTLSTLGFLSKLTLWPQAGQKSKQRSSVVNDGKNSLDCSNPRCIVQRMKEAGKNCVVFFSSQTGNAQDFAEKFAKDGHVRFGLETMVAIWTAMTDTLIKFPNDKIAIFVLSSYGEGEPTDNAVRFYEFVTDENPVFLEETDGRYPLQPMKYAAFGLGNSTYEHYNAVIRMVDASLERLGARRISVVGEGDDGKGIMEDSFLAWKECHVGFPSRRHVSQRRKGTI